MVRKMRITLWDVRKTILLISMVRELSLTLWTSRGSRRVKLVSEFMGTKLRVTDHTSWGSFRKLGPSCHMDPTHRDLGHMEQVDSGKLKVRVPGVSTQDPASY